MTIQDYFRQAGITSERSGGVRRDARAPAQGLDNRFADALAQAGGAAAPPPSATGQRIGDYLRRPVTARPPRIQRPPETQTDQSSVSENKAMPPQPDPRSLSASSAKAAPIVSLSPHAVQHADSQVPHVKPENPRTESARIDHGIERAAEKYKLPAGLIRSVIRAESNFEVRAVSRAGAQGLMQLMPATASDLGVKDPFDIEQNIDGGSRYLRKMLDQFGGDLKLALSAYNAGPGKVARYNGDVPYRETRDYVRRVLAFSERYSPVSIHK